MAIQVLRESCARFFAALPGRSLQQRYAPRLNSYDFPHGNNGNLPVCLLKFAY
ncbi:hypothetical protein [Alkalinema pantanalense]|uniref:hypothetical protein n=1 Tax=Alkalinema pantanalense TaxID=1620705 RepID=UPI003D6EDC0B